METRVKKSIPETSGRLLRTEMESGLGRGRGEGRRTDGSPERGRATGTLKRTF